MNTFQSIQAGVLAATLSVSTAFAQAAKSTVSPASSSAVEKLTLLKN